MNINSDLIVLYVDDVAVSAAFYSDLFGRQPVDQTQGFALFALDSGMKLGLFLRQVVQPGTSMTGGGCELVVMTDTRDKVDAIVADWRKRKIVIGADTADAPFGYTAVALDPDQHRIRVLYDPRA